MAYKDTPENRELIRSKDREFYAKNKKCILERKRKYYESKRVEKLEKARAHYNLNSSVIKARRKKYCKENHKAIIALCAKRRADKKQRTPKWANLEAIRKFYKNCPIGMVVDHIIPLNGKNVSGLHVENNLQYLTPAENSRKSNKFELGV